MILMNVKIVMEIQYYVLLTIQSYCFINQSINCIYFSNLL